MSGRERMRREKMDRKETNRRPVSATFKVGAIALVFLIIGYQTALFIYKASVVSIAERRDRPDTVYVVDRALARELLGQNAPANGLDAPTEGNAPEEEPLRAEENPGGDRIIRRNAQHSDALQEVARTFAPRRYESFRFNPNTADVDELMRLGFSEKQALSIESYRARGGYFHRKSDFAKSYVVSDTLFERLEEYIDIPLLDINKADSAAFDNLPGIGPFYAARMVEYREKLRGYSYPEQLMEIWKFDAERFDGLKDLIFAGPAESYPLWRLGEDSLKLHPYIGDAAHGIVLFRENTPRKQWSVDNLQKAGILNSRDAIRLARCRIEDSE